MIGYSTRISLFVATLSALLFLLSQKQQVYADQDNYNGGYESANYGYSSSVYGANAYADSSQSYYDGYAQAWRYLGWYVDCNGGSSRYYQRSGGGSQDQDYSKMGNNYCQRYLMWAAVSSFPSRYYFLLEEILHELTSQCMNYLFVDAYTSLISQSRSVLSLQ